MQTEKNNTLTPHGWELIKIILVGFFIFLAFGLAGKYDQEREQIEAEATHQILTDNGVIRE